MFSFPERVWALVLVFCAAGVQAQSAAYPGIGRIAKPAELAAWDIDVRPDFKGLPKGSGTVAAGMEVWEGKCASCHGIFGESNEVFGALTGGNTKEDVASGQVARLNDRAFPGRTTMMKLSQMSTLWDYINRAMPWNAPKSLTSDQVYAVTAYLLNLGGVLPENFTLSDQTMAQAQAMLPNRNGMTTEHALWPGPEFGNLKPDVQATACMKDCPVDTRLSSSLPDFARNAHGNLAEQNRLVGAQHGADTTRPAGAPTGTAGAAAPAGNKPEAVAAATPVPAVGAAAALVLTQKNACVACHGMDNKIIGPAFRDIARKYAGRTDAVDYLSGKIRAGGAGVWGAIPMPQQGLGAADARTIAQWLAQGAGK
ncbi:MAG: c-type cytochrome [Burkholderiaceae bacterium]